MVSFFHNVIDFLNKQKIPYMLTGSMAMAVYTVGRSTQDFDFVVELKGEDITSLVTHFSKGFYCNEDSVKDAIRRKSMFNIIEHSSGFKADFIILKGSDYQQTAFDRRSQVPLLETQAFVISGEDLILSKLIWMQQSESGRQKEDIALVSKNPDLDWTYIRYWRNRLELRTFDLF